MQAEIKNIDLEIEELENEYAGCGAMGYEEKSAPTNKFNSVVENEMIAKRFKPEQLEKRKHKLKIQLEKIDNALDILTEQQKKVIELRYINPKKLSWFDIADIMDLSDVTCRTLKNSAMNRMIPIIVYSEN
jgi:DNA-directed RNA polymerase specialized sigma24 family protein